MNKRFYQLESQKQMDIINAGIEYFARFEYKKASTEDIAKSAGISKSLLFHYFKNKETYFAFLYNYAEELIASKVFRIDLSNKTDFFEELEIVIENKCIFFAENPYLIDFLAKVRNSDQQFVQNIINLDTVNLAEDTIKKYFSNIELKKFKEDIKPEQIIEMLILLLDGYLSNRLKLNEKVELDDIMGKYKRWAKVLKQSVYKEEFL